MLALNLRYEKLKFDCIPYFVNSKLLYILCSYTMRNSYYGIQLAKAETASGSFEGFICEKSKNQTKELLMFVENKYLSAKFL